MEPVNAVLISHSQHTWWTPCNLSLWIHHKKGPPHLLNGEETGSRRRHVPMKWNFNFLFKTPHSFSCSYSQHSSRYSPTNAKPNLQSSVYTTLWLQVKDRRRSSSWWKGSNRERLGGRIWPNFKTTNKIPKGFRIFELLLFHISHNYNSQYRYLQ